MKLRRSGTSAERKSSAKAGQDILNCMYKHHMCMMNECGGNERKAIEKSCKSKMRIYFKVNKATTPRAKEMLLLDLFELHHNIKHGPSIIENAAAYAAEAYNYIYRNKVSMKDLPQDQKWNLAFSKNIMHVYLIPQSIMISFIKHFYKKKYKVDLNFA